MINIEKLSTALYKLVGFRQPFNPDYAKVDTDNQVSRSGYFVTDNPFAKIETIFDSQDYHEISDANFNILLKRKQQESIINVCNSVFNEADFIDRQMLYQYPMNKINTEVLPIGFIGHKITIDFEKNIAVSIKRILLNFSGEGDIKILLFNTAIKAPIKTKTVTINSDFQEVVLDWIIDFTDKYFKGDFYLGYINNGSMVPVPYKRDYYNSIIETSISFIDTLRIWIPDHITETLWDLQNFRGTNITTGLNPDIAVYEDFTDLIINTERLFAEAICTDLTISCITEILASIRSNKNERLSTINVLRLTQEIEGQKGEEVLNITGLRPQLSRSIFKIRSEIKKLKDGYNGDGLMIETMV